MEPLKSSGKYLQLTDFKASELLGRSEHSCTEVRKVYYKGKLCVAKAFKREFDNMFWQEYKILNKLAHKNIVQLLGVSSDSDMNILVLEYMKYNLTELLVNYEDIHMYVKLSLMRDISEGVQYLHSRTPAIAHLNLSSYKIYVTTSLTAKISSFKIAKEVFPDEIIIREKTQDQVIKLPEKRYNGTYSDIFFLGCIICRIIRQIYQPPKRKTRESMTEVKRRDIDSDKIKNAKLRELVTLCLDETPSKRPTATVVFERLQSIITEYQTDTTIKAAYAKAFQEGQTKFNNLQIVLVGAEKTGKTSLIHTFLDKEFCKQTAEGGIELKVCQSSGYDWKLINFSEKMKYLDYKLHSESRGPALLHMLDKNTDKKIGQQQGSCKDKSVEASNTNPIMDEIADSPAKKMRLSNELTSQTDENCFDITIWDFPGQTIYHKAHSFFISRKGILMITFNASLNPNDKIYRQKDTVVPPECCTVISSIHYWFQVADSVCRAEGTLSVSQPVAILVGTHIDLLDGNINKARQMAKEKWIPALKMEFSGKKYFNHLAGSKEGINKAIEKSCYFVSNETRDDEINRIKDAVNEAGDETASLQSTVFFKIEQEIIKHKRKVLKKSEFAELIEKCTPSMTDGSEEFFEGVLRYFNDRRSILYLSEVDSLKNTVILSPNWLSNLYSFILTAYKEESMDKNISDAISQLRKGIYYKCLIIARLEKFKQKYPDKNINYNQMIDLFLKFHLLYYAGNNVLFRKDTIPVSLWKEDAYIVPSLLPDGEEFPIPITNQERHVYFQFEEGYVSTIVLHQLIAKCICKNAKEGLQLLWLTHSKVALGLDNADQHYYISHSKDKDSIMLTITLSQNLRSSEAAYARKNIIGFVRCSIIDILQTFMPNAQKLHEFVPCQHCSQLHIYLEEIQKNWTHVCPNDKSIINHSLQSGYYLDLMNVTSDETEDLQLCKGSELRESIETAHPEFKWYINFRSLCPYLDRYKIFTRDEMQIFDKKESGEDCVAHLVRWLPQKSEEGVLNFAKALYDAREHSGHCELLKKLKVKVIQGNVYSI